MTVVLFLKTVFYYSCLQISTDAYLCPPRPKWFGSCMYGSHLQTFVVCSQLSVAREPRARLLKLQDNDY